MSRAACRTAYGDLQFHKSLAGLADGADPGNRTGILAGGIRELAMPFILAGALTGHRNSRRSMTDCFVTGRFAQN